MPLMISASSASASACVTFSSCPGLCRIRRCTLRALSSLPLPTRKRGDSGRKSMRSARSTSGAAPRPIIQRHWLSTPERR